VTVSFGEDEDTFFRGQKLGDRAKSLSIRLAAMDRYHTRLARQPAYRGPLKYFRLGQNMHATAQWEGHYHGVGNAQMVTYQ
jgi:hypothetical protein